MSNMLIAFLSLIRDNLPIIILVAIIFLITMSISLAVIFQKMGEKFWKGLIPIYNIVVLLMILEIPIWMMLLLFTPFVNIFGTPILMVIVGDKIGRKCRKGGIFKLGLMLLPIIFIPILAMTDFVENRAFNAKKIQVVEVKEEFKLDPVVIADTVEIQDAMSLSELENMSKLAEIKAKAKQTIEVKKELTAEEREEHLKKADKESPTAKDLTFDYDVIYGGAAPIPETIAPVEKVKSETVVDYKPLTVLEPIIASKSEMTEEVVEEPNAEITGIPEIEEPILEPIPEVVEEVKPVIHDIVLEEATPVDESSIGVIPINSRHDKQKNNINSAENLESPVVADIIVDEIPTPETFVDIQIPQMAAAPDFNVNIAPPEILEPSVSMPVDNTQFEQIISMQIEEPDQLPVAVLVQEEPEVPEVVVEEQRTPFIDIPASIEKKEQNFDDVQLYANPSDIFQTGGNMDNLLRPMAPQQQAQIDKICPKCGVKLKRDSNVCFMCGYSF